jgi:hypothetical protein
MKQSRPWEANRLSASQEVPLILWIPKGPLPHSQVPATCPYLGQFDLVNVPNSHFLKIHVNIILPSTLKFTS